MIDRGWPWLVTPAFLVYWLHPLTHQFMLPQMFHRFIVGWYHQLVAEVSSLGASSWSSRWPATSWPTVQQVPWASHAPWAPWSMRSGHLGEALGWGRFTSDLGGRGSGSASQVRTIPNMPLATLKTWVPLLSQGLWGLATGHKPWWTDSTEGFRPTSDATWVILSKWQPKMACI